MIAVYYSPEAMTESQYRDIVARVEALGIEFTANKHHSCFGEGQQLAVYEIWESKAAWDAFESHLTPILDEVGVKLSRPPDAMPIVEFQQ